MPWWIWSGCAYQARLAGGEPCHLYSEASFPIVGLSAGCRAGPLGNVLAAWKDRADRLGRDGVRAFLVLHRNEAMPPPESTALVAEVPSQGELAWFIYARR